MNRFIAFLAILWLAPAALAGSNSLGQAASPYLKSHASDPVHWRQWGPEAFKEAKTQNKPILLSIGYLTCHWCHVMQKESFTDPETAALINARFIPILVDREERLDIDKTYMDAATILGGQAGWPLNVFLLPDGRPYWSGVYFPKEPAYGLPSFKNVLNTMANLYRDKPQDLLFNANIVGRALETSWSPTPGELTAKDLGNAALTILKEADPFMGGFGAAPKHPELPNLERLWRHHIRTGNTEAGDQVSLSLKAMIRGGLFDHLGGGFFRYATDNQWHIPHFEKMLDINAELISLMTEVWRETQDPELAYAIDQTVSFILREMQADGGAFASALDADSIDNKGIMSEGAYYVWTESQIESVIGAKSKRFFDAYGLSPLEEENDGHGFALHRLGDDRLDETLASLFDARSKRFRPQRDNKVLADQNGLTIAALADASHAFNRRDWLKVAVQAYVFIENNLSENGIDFHHSWVDGRRGSPALSTDYAGLLKAALALHQATGEKAYLGKAEAWGEQAVKDFWDEKGGGFFTGPKERLTGLPRPKTMQDGPIPSTNALLVDSFARLYALTGDPKWRDRAEQSLTTFAQRMQAHPRATSGLFNGADTLFHGLQIVIIGNPDVGFMAPFKTRSLPGAVMETLKNSTDLPSGHPAYGKLQIDGKTTAYVCRATFCSLPVTTKEELRSVLTTMRRVSL